MPKKIINKLDSLFPGEKVVDWNKYRGHFRANFNYKTQTESLSFDENGKILGWLEEIPFESLPLAISKKIESEFGDYKKLFVLKILNKENPHYEIEVMKGNLQYMLSFNLKYYLTGFYKIYRDDPFFYAD